MVYANKTYISFDWDNDINYYRLMQAWKENDNIEFNFHNAHNLNNITDRASEDTIKSKLRERMKNTNLFILLVWQHTKYLYKYVRWEIEEAKKRDIPIIVVNLNWKRYVDEANCPASAANTLAIHVSFNKSIIYKAIKQWPNWHKIYKKEWKDCWFVYSKEVYDESWL